MSIYNDSFKHMSKTLTETMEHISQVQKELAISATFSYADTIAKVMEPYRNLSKTLQKSFSISFSNIMDPYISELTQTISNSICNNLNETLRNSVYFQELSSAFRNITPGELDFISHSHTYDSTEIVGGLPRDEDDFVIADESIVKTYNLPKSVYIHLGNHRVKIPTPTFIAIIGIILNTIVSISLAIAQSNSSQAAQTEQIQIEEAQLQLQNSQNELLQQFLHNVDVSSSSEAESIRELKEAVEEQNKQFSQIQDTTASTAKDLDSSEEAEDTDGSK